MFGFSTDSALSLLRHLLTFIAGVIVSKGWITSDMAVQLVGAILTIVGALFAIFFHAQSNGTIPTISTTTNLQQTKAADGATSETKTVTVTQPAQDVLIK